MFKNADIATILYSYFFLGAGLLAALAYISKNIIKTHTESIRDDLSKIMYDALSHGSSIRD